jgi:hypothetical protein
MLTIWAVKRHRGGPGLVRIIDANLKPNEGDVPPCFSAATIGLRATRVGRKRHLLHDAYGLDIPANTDSLVVDFYRIKLYSTPGLQRFRDLGFTLYGCKPSC